MMGLKIECLKRVDLYSADRLFECMVARIEEGWR